MNSSGAVAAAVFEHSGSLLSLLTENTRATATGSNDKEEEHAEPLSTKEKKVKPKAVVDGEAEVSRAHLLPRDEQSKIFWGARLRSYYPGPTTTSALWSAM